MRACVRACTHTHTHTSNTLLHTYIQNGLLPYSSRTFYCFHKFILSKPRQLIAQTFYNMWFFFYYLCTTSHFVGLCMGGSKRKLVYYICHKISSVLYRKYSTVVSKYSTVSLRKQPPLPTYVCGFLLLLIWIYKDITQ